MLGERTTELENAALPSAKASPPQEAVRFVGRQQLFSAFFFAALLFLLYELIKMMAPFLAPLLGAAMLALVVFPLQPRLGRKLGSETIAASLLTVAVTFAFVIPVALLGWVLIREAGNLVPAIDTWMQAHDGETQSILPTAQGALLDRAWRAVAEAAGLVDLDLRSIALEAARDLANRVAVASGQVVRQTLFIAFQLIVLLLALFFFLRDGPRMVAAALDLIPMENESKALVVESLDRTLVALLRGTIVTSVVQSALLGVGLAMFGAPVPVLLSFAGTILAFIPFVGTALIWVPVAVYLAATGSVPEAIGLALWGLIVVGLVDNFLRPIIVGGHAKLPPTLLFLGILGGLQAYGLVGGLMSPLVIACLFAFIRIYRERYLSPMLAKR